MAAHWQPSVGTVVKTAADEDPIGLLTVLSLGSHGHLRCVQEVRAYLASCCPTASEEQKLAQVHPIMHRRPAKRATAVAGHCLLPRGSAVRPVQALLLPCCRPGTRAGPACW